MPYDTPNENKEMTTSFARVDIPRVPKSDQKTTSIQEIEMDLIFNFKKSVV